MDKIEIEDINDTIALERIFAHTAFKYLSTVEYTKPDSSYSGEKLRTIRELEAMELRSDKAKKIAAEKRIEKAEDSSDSLDEDIDEVEVSKKERTRMNKKKYVSGVTRGKRRKAVRNKKKAKRRRGNR